MHRVVCTRDSRAKSYSSTTVSERVRYLLNTLILPYYESFQNNEASLPFSRRACVRHLPRRSMTSRRDSTHWLMARCREEAAPERGPRPCRASAREYCGRTLQVCNAREVFLLLVSASGRERRTGAGQDRQTRSSFRRRRAATPPRRCLHLPLLLRSRLPQTTSPSLLDRQQNFRLSKFKFNISRQTISLKQTRGQGRGAYS